MFGPLWSVAMVCFELLQISEVLRAPSEALHAHENVTGDDHQRAFWELHLQPALKESSERSGGEQEVEHQVFAGDDLADPLNMAFAVGAFVEHHGQSGERISEGPHEIQHPGQVLGQDQNVDVLGRPCRAMHRHRHPTADGMGYARTDQRGGDRMELVDEVHCENASTSHSTGIPNRGIPQDRALLQGPRQAELLDGLRTSTRPGLPWEQGRLYKRHRVGCTQPPQTKETLMTDEDKPPDFSDVEGGSSSTAPTSQSKTYTIAKGDTLSKIAHNEYGDSKLWRKIFEHNKDVIKDPDKIFPGQVISLPPKEDLLS